MNVQTVSGANPVSQPSDRARTAAIQPPEASLMPPPNDTGGDPMLALLGALAKQRQHGTALSMKEVETNTNMRKTELKKQLKAYLDALAEQKKGGFFKDIAKACGKLGKVGTLVAAAAVVVGTGGAGAPFVLACVGAGLSAAAIAQSEYKILQELGVDDKTAMWMEVGMTVGGAGCTGGAVLAANTTAAASAANAGARSAGQIGATTGAAASVAGGAATIGAAVHEKREKNFRADAEAATREIEWLKRMFDMAIKGLEAQEEDEERLASTLGKAIETRDSTAVLIARRV